jgi:hypothetical protein
MVEEYYLNVTPFYPRNTKAKDKYLIIAGEILQDLLLSYNMYKPLAEK